MSFGQYLKKIRTEKKISQRALAVNVGVDFTYLSKIENDKMPPPSEETLRKLASELNTDVDTLILMANKMPSEYKGFLKSSKDMPLMLRTLSGLPEDKQKEVFEFIKKKNKEL